MAPSRFAVILAIVAVAGAFVASSFYAAPDDPTSGAAIPDAQGEEKLIPGDSAAHAGNTDSPPEPNLKTSQTSTGESHSQEVSSQAIDVPGAEVSFDDYMLLPGADAESYALVNGAMDANRLEELATPEEFDKFAGALERQAKVESRETAEEYRTALFEAANSSGVSVTVDSVSCGTSLCTAKIHSLDTADLDRYLAALWSSGQIPMYATMEMQPEASGTFDVRRLVFTTDPAVSAFEFTPD
jgi:hypothetical protein